MGDSGTYGDQVSASMGIVIPFGSNVHDSCKNLAKQISVDKQISSQLSMIRACASLDKEGIAVDPIKFPLLSKCVIDVGQPEILTSKIINVDNRSKETKSKQEKKVIKIPTLLDDWF